MRLCASLLCGPHQATLVLIAYASSEGSGEPAHPRSEDADQAVSQEEPSDRKPDPSPLWMAGHAQSNFVMTESSKKQIRLTRPMYYPLDGFVTLYSFIRNSQKEKKKIFNFLKR